MEIQSAFMGAAAAAVLLVAVLMQRREPATPSFAALTLCYGFWCLGRGATGLDVAWGRPVADLALVAIGPLALTVAAGFAHRSAQIRPIAPFFLLAPILAYAIVAAGSRPEVDAAAHVWALLGLAGGAIVLARPLYTDVDAAEAVRLRYLSIAHTIVALGALADVVMWQLAMPRVGTLLPPVLYLYAGYLHLARVRVADLRQLMGNVFALTLMAIGLAAFFAAIRIWVGERLDLFVFNAFVASFALLIGFQPVRHRIQAAMDRRFVAPRLELERSLGPLRERLTHILTLDEVIQELLATLDKTPSLRLSSIFLRDDVSMGFQQAGSIGLPPRTRVSLVRHPVFVAALEQTDVLLASEIAAARQAERDETERARLERLERTLSDMDAELLLPLRAGEALVGFWTLSDSRSEESFSTDEVRLLREVADLLAVSIDNSKTFERIRARDRLASLGEMAAGLAHEIRNPLAAIRGSLAVLEPPEDAERSEFHEIVVEEIQRLDRVVEAFLDYARPWTDEIATIDDIGGLVEACVDCVARAQNAGGVTVDLAIDTELPRVRADGRQLERVLVNVVQNAYEALPGRGAIRVAVRVAPGAAAAVPRVEIAIEDDGPGMDEATLERAFVPFYTTKERGTGMGLALCERMVRAQNGSIELHSRPGAGTTVLIRLEARPPTGEDAE